jgi:hypothetical protein
MESRNQSRGGFVSDPGGTPLGASIGQFDGARVPDRWSEPQGLDGRSRRSVRSWKVTPRRRPWRVSKNCMRMVRGLKVWAQQARRIGAATTLAHVRPNSWPRRARPPSAPLSAAQTVLRIATANPADSANSGHALVESGEAAIPTAAAPAAAVMGAPWIVPGVSMRADHRDADENCGHEEESLHDEYSVWAVSYSNPGPGCFNPPCPEGAPALPGPRCPLFCGIVAGMNDDEVIRQRIEGHRKGASHDRGAHSHRPLGCVGDRRHDAQRHPRTRARPA